MTTGTRPARAPRRAAPLLAVACATVLSVTAFAGQAAAEDTAPAQVIEIADGQLDWGVKESFRRYLTGPIAGGSAEVSAGAEATENGYRFTGGSGSYDLTTHGVSTAFDGAVHFTGHHGELDLELADLRVVTAGTGGHILADVTVAGATTEDVAFATLDLTGVAPGQGEGGAMVFADIPATLTADGATAFEYQGTPMYDEGTELDPATLTVTPAAGGEDPDTENPGDTGGPGGTGGSEGTGGTGGSEGTGGTGGSEEPEPLSGEIVDGRLDWGVKESFRSYVTGPIAGGEVELTGGATESADGYRFPDATGALDTEAATLDSDFAGGVRFTGHEGQLDLRFSAFGVEVADGEGALVADVSSKDRESGEVTEYTDLTVAELDVPADALNPEGDVLALDGVPATLTADGAEAFGGFYEAGEELDPVSVSLAFSEDARLPDGDGGSTGGDSDGATGGLSPQGGASGGALAATGAGGQEATLLGAAGVLALGGLAAVRYARVRRVA
ncbi:Htaa protein [Streptomyces zhaozhouensis]|uniref:Htaa protein n=1 Tax=Streptomyces zhaozhouensis TaxID=1300267 RepID=A0A286DJN4_9ACTN|nr:HtaA domain-containing protein [Streptomyces zhaozhouensis]SOD58967.1 Htaa protein [Streptomyces zhaozhouensis]